MTWEIIGIDCENEAFYNEFVQSDEFQQELKNGVMIEEAETRIHDNRCFKMMVFAYRNTDTMKRLVELIFDYNHRAYTTWKTIPLSD